MPSNGAPRTDNVSAYANLLQQYCKVWPTSRFYLERLRQYINSTGTRGSGDYSVYDLGSDEDGFYPRQVTQTTEVLNPKIIVVKGIPAVDVLCELGLRYALRPELLLGHLELERVIIKDRTSFELPTLPSRRQNIVHVRLVTLGRRFGKSSGDAIDATARKVADENSEALERSLLDQYHTGATRIRKVNLHNQRYFSVEQNVSYALHKSSHIDDSWTGLFFLDQGHPFRTDAVLPWDAYCVKQIRKPETLNPIRYNEQYEPNSTRHIRRPTLTNDEYIMHPYHPLEEEVFSPEQLQLLATDPFFCLSRLYQCATLSWHMILNFMDDEITTCQTASAEESTVALSNVRFNMSLTQRFEGFINTDLEVIRNGTWGEWAEDDPDGSQDTVIESIRLDLIRDYAHLSQRCQTLLSRCQVSSGILQSTIGITETQLSIQQTREVNNLTKLAFFFIPLSTIASIFGMNVREITDKNPSIWVFCLIAGVLAVVAWFLSLTPSIRQDLLNKLRRISQSSVRQRS